MLDLFLNLRELRLLLLLLLSNWERALALGHLASSYTTSNGELLQSLVDLLVEPTAPDKGIRLCCSLTKVVSSWSRLQDLMDVTELVDIVIRRLACVQSAEGSHKWGDTTGDIGWSATL